jgi:hypothetical protein
LGQDVHVGRKISNDAAQAEGDLPRSIVRMKMAIQQRARASSKAVYAKQFDVNV